MTDLLKIVRLTPVLLVVACAAPKPIVIEEPKKPKPEAPKVASAPVLPVNDEAEQLRLPGGILEKLPDRNEFQPSNPSAPGGNRDGAPVIARPPSDPPPATR